MTHITFTVSDEMKKEMERFSEIDWFKLSQDAIQEKLTSLKAAKLPIMDCGL